MHKGVRGLGGGESRRNFGLNIPQLKGTNIVKILIETCRPLMVNLLEYSVSLMHAGHFYKHKEQEIKVTRFPRKENILLDS